MRHAWMIAVLLSVAARGAGADPQSHNANYRAGTELFKKHDYVGAAEKFKAAYAVDSDASYLFDAAQAYRLAHECELSIRYYRQFLGLMPSSPNADQINIWIETQEACAKEHPQPKDHGEPAAATAPHADDHDEHITTTAPHAEEHEEHATTTSPQTLDTELPHADASTDETATTVHVKGRGSQAENHTRRGLAIGSVVVATVALGVGAYFTYDATNLAHARQDLCAAGCVWSDVSARAGDLDSRGARASGIAIGSYVVSGIGIAAGIGLYATSRRHVDLMVAPSPGGASAGVRMSF